jgi:hypothetical protein
VNCKPGDLAVMVRSMAGNEGKIVRCIRVIGAMRLVSKTGVVVSDLTWEIEPQILNWKGDLISFAHDGCLRPIRPNDGEDEMLTIAGHPTETVEDILRELGA